MKNYNAIEKPKPKTLEEGINLMIDGFSGAVERDINTGDKIHIMILSQDGTVEHRTSPLRFD